MELVPADLHFCYEETFGVKGVGAYDRLLLEVIEGNRLLFASSTEVKESWRIVEPALKAFKENTPPLHRYTAGSNGPGATDAMLNADGEHWLNETFDICKQSHG
jgi:glucose-6-phosphate 1-dehydrogenase